MAAPLPAADSAAPLLAAALAYAALGWPVIPLHTPDAAGRCSCPRPDCDRVGKHPRTRNGVKDATADLAKIADWWKMWPGANVGVATGAESGLVVLDVDPDKGGDETLAALQASHDPLPLTAAVETGGGGRHLFFGHPGCRVPNSVGRLGPGLDIRGDGGLVVAPPSLHVSGLPYRWHPACPPDLPLAPLPAWILPTSDRPGRSAAQTGNEAPIPEGQRNTTLTSLAGRLRCAGLSEAAMRAALLVTNAERCDPPLGEAEVAKIAASVARYPVGPAVHQACPAPPIDRDAAAEAELAARHALTSAFVGVSQNPYLRSEAAVALRILTLVEHLHDSESTPDGFYRVSDSRIADADNRDQPIRSRSTVRRVRKRLSAWGLFEIETRTGWQWKERVDPVTGEIGRRSVPVKETWIRRDRPLLEKARQLAAFVPPQAGQGAGDQPTTECAPVVLQQDGARSMGAVGGVDVPESSACSPMRQADPYTLRNHPAGGPLPMHQDETSTTSPFYPDHGIDQGADQAPP